MIPRPALSTEWTALRSASKSLCWDAKFLTSDLKWVAGSSVMRPRQTRVKVPSGETLCPMVKPWSGAEAGFVDIQKPPKRSNSPPPSGIGAERSHFTHTEDEDQLQDQRSRRKPGRVFLFRTFSAESLVFGTPRASNSGCVVSISCSGPQRGVFGTWDTGSRLSVNPTIPPGRPVIASGLPTILQLTVNLRLGVDDWGCKIVHGSQRRASNRARRNTYEGCSRTRFE